LFDSISDTGIYQSVWEKAENIPGGSPLFRRTEFPEYMSPEEIASLIYDHPSDQKAISRQILRAISSGEIKSSGTICTTEPIDPSMVVRSLHSHIRLIEKKITQIETDFDQLLSTTTLLEKDIKELQKRVASILTDQISQSHEDYSKDKLNDRNIHRRLCGYLLEAKPRRPIRSSTGVGYDTNRRNVNFHLIHKDEFARWLKLIGEWPISSQIALQRWFIVRQKSNSVPLVNTIRLEMLQKVVDDLKDQGKDPHELPHKVQEILNYAEIG